MRHRSADWLGNASKESMVYSRVSHQLLHWLRRVANVLRSRETYHAMPCHASPRCGLLAVADAIMCKNACHAVPCDAMRCGT